MKTLPLLIGAAAVLSACSPAANPVPASSSQIQAFSGRGSVDLQGAVAPAPITASFGDAAISSTVTVGTLNADRTVSITVTPGMMLSAPVRTLAIDRVESGCDTSGVRVRDAQYSSLSDVALSVAGQEYGLRPGLESVDTEGGHRDTQYEYWYARQAGSYVGTSRCDRWTVNWKIVLVPGWNRIATTNTYNAVMGQYGETEVVSEGATRGHDGPWTTYRQ